MKISLYSNKDQDALLDLIAKSISTSRTQSSWNGNQMTAILARDNNNNLIGALPLEKREFNIGDGKTIKLLWISAAHVDPEYRSKGIGRKMDSFLRDHFNNKFDAVCAYCGDEKSRAYHWYHQLGFYPILQILAFRKHVNKINCISENRLIFNTEVDIKKYSKSLYSCFEKAIRNYGGFTMRDEKYWSHTFKYHYYKEFYKFVILAIQSKGNEFDAFALLGETDMKDGIKRYDILEFIASSKKTEKILHNNIESYAYEKNIDEVRIQTSAVEPMSEWVDINGYEYRNRSTNILASLINPSKYIEERYLELGEEKIPDLKIETPIHKDIKIMGNGEKVSLFMNDDTLHQLIFNRLDINHAVKHDKIILVEGYSETLLKISELFYLTPWRYFQSDYI